MFFLMMFMVPAFTSGAISGERERQTLVPLQVTLLRPREIVTGKLSASIAFLLLLLVSSAPLVSVAYMLGGMSFGQILAAIAGLLFVGVVFASLAVFCSAVFKRTQTASVMSYVLVFTLTLGTFIGWFMWTAITGSDGGNDGRPPKALLVWNPAVMLADVVASDAPGLGNGPWTSLADVLEPPEQFDVAFDDVGPVAFDEFGNPVGFADEGFQRGLEPLGNGLPPDDPPGRSDSIPFWLMSAIALMALSAATLAIAARRVSTPAAVER
jgi:hypothetical protein